MTIRFYDAISKKLLKNKAINARINDGLGETRSEMANLWKIWVLNFGINIIFTIILWNGKDFGWLNASCQIGLITLILYINKEKL